MTTDAKAYDFPLSVRWTSGRRTVVSVPGKDDLEVATPPEFKGGVEGVWSPEDLLVASVASCFAVTMLAVCERREVPIHGLEVGGSGHVTRRKDGRFGFTEIVLHAAVDTDPGREPEAEEAAEASERGCLVSCSVDFPVRLELDVRTAPAARAAL
jgi:organic hydroperoxide reductase OsmC/OhrA